MINWVPITRLGRTLTLLLCLSELLMTNLIFVLFLEQPQLPKRRTAAQSFEHLELSWFGPVPRVVPSQISNLECKRGQYQDSGFVRAKLH